MPAQPEAELILNFLEEHEILEDFQWLKKHGFGRLELIIVDGKLETINLTKTKKRRDFTRKGQNAS